MEVRHGGHDPVCIRNHFAGLDGVDLSVVGVRVQLGGIPPANWKRVKTP